VSGKSAVPTFIYQIYQRPLVLTHWWLSWHRLNAIWSPLSKISAFHVVSGSSLLETWDL